VIGSEARASPMDVLHFHGAYKKVEGLPVDEKFPF
jgi:hypothetical protein